MLSSLERLGDASTIIYTTHSHHLINPNWLENTHVVRNKGIEASTEVTDYHARKTDIVIDRYRAFASQHPEQSNYFQPVLDILDYAPSKLELVPDMVMAEGKNDYYVLTYMHDVILELGLDLHFLPGGGAGSLDQMIRLYLGWARRFVVLLDSDAEGMRQKSRYAGLFGPIVESRIVTLGDLASDLVGKSMEGVFDLKDLDAIQSIAYPREAYTKKKFCRALQEVLVTHTSVPLTDATTSRFSQLLNNLRTRLDSLT